MKKITKTLYQCSYCEQEFEEKEECLDCERQHEETLKLFSVGDIALFDNGCYAGEQGQFNKTWFSDYVKCVIIKIIKEEGLVKALVEYGEERRCIPIDELEKIEKKV